MKIAPLRANETTSLSHLNDLDVLDSEPEQAFQALVEVASTVCGTPISLISLIDTDRQWFKANLGLPGATETPRDVAFCAHAVLGEALFEVSDARRDERFFDNPLVVGAPDIRFYAGMPIEVDDGVRVGTLCVIDREPRTLSEPQKTVLRQLAGIAAQALKGRAAQRRLHAEINSQKAHANDLTVLLDAVPSMMAYWDLDLRCRFANKAYLAWFGIDPDKLIGLHICDLLGPELFESNRPFLEAALRGESQTFERDIPLRHGDVRRALAFYIPDFVDGRVAGVLVQVTDITPQKQQEEALRRETEKLHAANSLLKQTSLALDEAQELSQLGSWEWNVGSEVVSYSRQYCRIFGFDFHIAPLSSEEKLSCLLPESQKLIRPALERCLKEGVPYSLEVQMRRLSDGKIGWVESKGAAVRDSRGAIVALRGTAQDISHRKETELALLKSQKFLEQTGQLAEVGGWELDLKSGAIYWSPEVCRIVGVDPGYQPSLTEVIEFYDQKSRSIIKAAVENTIQSGEKFDLELKIIRRDGDVRDVRALGIAEFRHGEAVRLSGAFQDITDRQNLARELAHESELLRVTLQSIADAVITTNAAGDVTWINPAAEQMTGWLAPEAKGQPLRQVFHIVNEKNQALASDPIRMCIEKNARVGLTNHTILIARDGSERCIEDSAAPIRSQSGEVLGAVLVFHDVSEQRRLSNEMTFRATHDVLTGLLNRAEFEVRLQRALDSSKSNFQHALLFIDLDQFKIVNDTCGHAIGDKLLQKVARLLEEAIRSRDSLARLGGDEFAIILEHCPVKQAQRVAQNICARMDEFRFLHDDRRFRIGASIGLVPIDSRWVGTEAIKQAADAACYAAKEAGRNRVHEWFDTDVAMRARHGEMQWTTRIQKALDNDELILFAQRIQSLQCADDGLRVEVLVRMKDADGKLIQPSAFLPSAERYHLISSLDRSVVSKTIAWMQTLDFVELMDHVSINLSGQSVGDRAFHEWIYAKLASIDNLSIRKKLCFEITETAAVTNMEDAAVFIQELHQLGVRVALDDFGAGASSFGYLKHLAVDYLKIDGQFVRELDSNPLHAAAVRCFVDVAKVVGMRTVAEFVENQLVMDHLRGLGVDFAQGDLVHKPEPLQDVFTKGQH